MNSPGERIIKMNLARRAGLDKLYADAESEAKRDLARHLSDPLFVSGVSLYWGEGDKRTRHQVRVSNTDPALIRSFLKFLRRFGEVPDERVWVSLIAYPDIPILDCEGYWQRELGLDGSHFQKTVVIQGRGKERKSAYGICVLGVSSTVLKVKMLTWIAELPKNL